MEIVPTFSYFLTKIPTFSYFFDVSYYLTPWDCVTGARDRRTDPGEG